MDRTAVGGLVLAASMVVAAVSCGGGGAAPEVATTAPASTTDTASGPVPLHDPVVIAHRGSSAAAPEHTFAAYDLALEQGADYLELDVQLTADGELVVLHDEVLDRVARGPADACTGAVSDKTLAQLRECDAGSWFNEWKPDQADPAFADQRIPSVQEVFERYGDTARYYIEIKSPADQPGIEQALVDLVDEYELGGAAAPDQVVVQSFSPDSLRAVASLRPDLPLVQLLPDAGAPVDPAALDSIAEYAAAIGPADGIVDATLVTAAHERCLGVHPWTIDDPDELTALRELGVDGMFTNHPELLVAVATDRPGTLGPCAETDAENESAD